MNSRNPQERVARFKQRPEILEVTFRYAGWAVSPDGIQVNVRLAGFAILYLRRRISRAQYERDVRKIAVTIPKHDFAHLAQCQLEAVRCMLAGSGQIPFDPFGWDAEDRSI